MTPTPSELSLITLIIAATSAAALIVFSKWGLIDRLQMNATEILGQFKELAHCNFCLLFWIAVFITAPLIFSASFLYLACPMPAASLAALIYEGSKNKGGGH